MDAAKGEGAAQRRPATLKDVVAATGLGMGTVSRALSGSDKVSAEARRRVEEAARDLDYVPSAVGRGLKRQSTDNIGLLVADISNTFYSNFAHGVLQAAKSWKRNVILCASDVDVDTERSYIDLLTAQRVDWIIAFPTGSNRDSWLRAVRTGVNLLFIDDTVKGVPAQFVGIDNHLGARMLTEHLIALGHRRIAYLGGPNGLHSVRTREDGFREAHARAGLPVVDRMMVRTSFTVEIAHASARHLLESSERPSALVAANNVMGEAALAAVQDLRLSVPDDISIVMFDDAPWASLIRPGITVLAQPVQEMGQVAAKMAAGAADLAGPIILPPQLIVRGSTQRREREESHDQ